MDVCANCNTEFQPTRKLKKYCSKECQIMGKRKSRQLYKERLKLNYKTQTERIVESLDSLRPSEFIDDADDILKLFSDWKSFINRNSSATGRALKYTKSNGHWLLSGKEAWTLEQWGEWLSNCRSQDVAYVLTGVAIDDYEKNKLLNNDTLATFSTGGKYCLSYYSREISQICINFAPPWGQNLIWQWQDLQHARLSIFFVARGTGTVLFNCCPQTYNSTDVLRSIVNKCSSDFHAEKNDANQIIYTVDNSQTFEEKVAAELDISSIIPLPVEVAQGQGIVIPSRQAFWYKYSKANGVSNDDPLILISGHGDYVGPTTESFRARFKGLFDSPDDARIEDSLFSVVKLFCIQKDVSPTEYNHATAALQLFQKLNLKHRNEERKKFYADAETRLGQVRIGSNSGLIEEESTIANETSPVKQDIKKRKENDYDTADQPPLKKFKDDVSGTTPSSGKDLDEMFRTRVAKCNLPQSVIVLPLDTWKSRPTNFVDSIKNKKYAIVPVLDHCSLIIFVDLHKFLTEKTPSCTVMYCNTLCQRLKKPEIVSFLSSFLKTKPSWSSIRVMRINNDSVDESLSTLVLINYLELFASKPFASKEEMTKEDKAKWHKSKKLAGLHATKVTESDHESADTENDSDSM